MKIDVDDLGYFQNELVPAGCVLAGGAALVAACSLEVPMRRFSCVRRI